VPVGGPAPGAVLQARLCSAGPSASKLGGPHPAGGLGAGDQGGAGQVRGPADGAGGAGQVLRSRFAGRLDFSRRFREACHRQDADGRLDATERTLFGALRLSWGVLEGEEREALLDVALLLRGQPWGLVEQHCGEGVLRRLWGLGLVKKDFGHGANGRRGPADDGASECLATVHSTVASFCEDAAATGRAPERLALSPGDARSKRQQVGRVCYGSGGLSLWD
jgi:hypothetical protein